MINGFDKHTAALSDKELKIMRLIAPHLKGKTGAAQAVTNKDISKGIERVHGIKLSPARLRKIINHIRIKAVIPRLVASSKGYYVEYNDFKFNEYVDSLHQRAASIANVAKALEAQKKYKNEKHLFTS